MFHIGYLLHMCIWPIFTEHLASPISFQQKLSSCFLVYVNFIIRIDNYVRLHNTLVYLKQNGYSIIYAAVGYLIWVICLCCRSSLLSSLAATEAMMFSGLDKSVYPILLSG
jgi:hypothetical protein